MTPDAMMAIERRLLEEAFNQGDLEMLRDVLSPDYVLHDNGQQEVHGVDGMKEFISTNRAAFPDLCITLDDIRAAGDVVVSRWTATMTHE
ncbi:MAG: ester cyclase, partial [Chloroflexota bacterium]